MTNEADAIAAAARAICQSRCFETGQGTCAVLCMDQLGDIRKKGCSHAERVHRKLAEAVVSAVAPLIAPAPELLKACQEVLRTGLDEEARHGDQRQAIELVRAAIAKAAA